MELKDCQEYALSLSAKHGWDKEPLSMRLAYLKCELKEVLNEVDNVLNSKTVEESEDSKVKLGHELFDLLWNVSDLANRFGIDLEASAQQKMAINNNREFSSKPSKVSLISHG